MHVGRFRRGRLRQILKATLEMDGLIATHSAIMDKYDPAEEDRARRRRVGRVVCAAARQQPRASWCSRTACATRVLAALNLNIFARHADRVRMANIAQMVNVLQAMILTDKEKMVLTPTYHVFKMYRAVPGRDVRAGDVRRRHLHARRHHAAARGRDRREGHRRHAVAGASRTSIRSARPTSTRASRASPASRRPARRSPAPKVDSVNTFDAPNTVVPKPITAKVQGGRCR